MNFCSNVSAKTNEPIEVNFRNWEYELLTHGYLGYFFPVSKIKVFPLKKIRNLIFSITVKNKFYLSVLCYKFTLYSNNLS